MTHASSSHDVLSSAWAATAEPGPEASPLHGDRRADVAVVGGGYTGLSAALHLAERGADAVVLDGAAPGWGASGRNGGQVIPGLKDDPDTLERRFGPETGRRMWQIAGAAADFVFDLIGRHKIACHAQQCGWISGAPNAAGVDILSGRAEQWQRRGAPVELLDRVRIAELTGTAVYAGGLLDRRAGALQPLAYVRGLARAAGDAGAVVHGRSPVTRLESHAGTWRVTTPGGTVTANSVILATNGYTDDLWPGLARTVLPVQSYQVATQPLPLEVRQRVLPGGQVVSDLRRILFYFRLDPGGRLIMGGRGPLNDAGDPALFARLEGVAARFFPQVASHEWAYRWTGRVALTADHLPHLHEPRPGLLAGLGYNGRGVAMATVMGKLLADRALGVPLEELGWPVVPITPITLHRWRLPVMALVVHYKRLRDWIDG
ncbi:MAG TPA: FAD-binding oxidoreductase [Candidatus Binatia bacterium]|nr:FAD-binding oxidoreductase [Candidatus Binatia bacterium]